MRRAIITTEALNSYGTRVLTAGIDLGQYERNPVMLYMHHRGEVIGVMKELRVEGDKITAEPDFDEASELSRRCKVQWEKGSLRMTSVGLDIVEMSEDPTLLVEGQTRPTITRSRLVEVSLVDVGANDEALALTKDGKRITLGAGSENPLPQLRIRNNKEQVTKTEMELKEIAQTLGLPETADEATVMVHLAALKEAESEAAQLRKEKEELELARIGEAVETAIKAGKLEEKSKGLYVEMGKKVGYEQLAQVLESIAAPRVSLSAQLHPAQPQMQAAGEQGQWKSLHEVPAEQMERLKAEQPQEYARLYKAEYGMELPQD